MLEQRHSEVVTMSTDRSGLEQEVAELRRMKPIPTESVVQAPSATVHRESLIPRPL